MAREALIFDANASKILSEIKKVTREQRNLEKAIESASIKAAKGSKQAAAEMEKLHAANAKLLMKKQELRRKVDEATKAQMNFRSVSLNAMTVIAGGLGIGSVNAALSTTLGWLRQILDANRQWRNELKNVAKEQDEVGRRLQVQALLSDEQFQKVLRERIAPASSAAGVSLERGQRVATELISQGFSTQQATGDALRELLVGAAASNAPDQVQFATGAAGYLKSQGKELSAKNVRALSARLTSLFQSKSIQGADLPELAQVGSILKTSGLTEEEQLATITALKEEGRPAAESATSARNVAMIMRTGKKMPRVSARVRKLGFGADFFEKTDLQGESFIEGLTNLDAELSKASAERGVDRATALTMMFGRENAGGAMTLLNQLPTMRKMIGIQRDTSKFELGAAIATTGNNARLQRIENEALLAKIGESRRQAPDIRVEERLRAAEINEGVSPAGRMVREKLRGLGHGVGLGTAASSRFASGLLASIPGSPFDIATSIGDEIRLQTALQKEQVETQKETLTILKAQQKGERVGRNNVIGAGG